MYTRLVNDGVVPYSNNLMHQAVTMSVLLCKVENRQHNLRNVVICNLQATTIITKYYLFYRPENFISFVAGYILHFNNAKVL